MYLFESTETVTCSISIADTGRGIPKEKIDRLFSPYAQTGDETAKRNGFGGTEEAAALGFELSDR
jgi:signal transduction histidine kinase